jgi:prevent-host-death family protein
VSQQFSVLFVDDEPRILDGLRRQLRASRFDWDMRFVESGEAAIRAMNESPADVVVSDMRMPGMNGAQVLRRVQQSWPDALRVILSGQTDQAELLGDIGAVHQFLQKPCDPDAVRATVLRAQTVRMLLESRRLRKVSAGVVSLPLLASTHTMLGKALDADASLTAISEIVERVQSTGQPITVTNRGRPAVEIVPCHAKSSRRMSRADAVREIARLRAELPPVGAGEIRDLIAEGRR